jgi:hypothetical protein
MKKILFWFNQIVSKMYHIIVWQAKGINDHFLNNKVNALSLIQKGLCHKNIYRKKRGFIFDYLEFQVLYSTLSLSISFFTYQYQFWKD